MKTIKDNIKKILALQSQRRSVKAAYEALNNIESWKGKTPKKLIQQSNEYAKEVLGSKKYAPWLYVYSSFRGEFLEGWIPDNYFSTIVIPAYQRRHGGLVGTKAFQSLLFGNQYFPDLYYLASGLWTNSNYEIKTGKEVSEDLKTNYEKIVFKIEDYSRGEGVSVLNTNSLNIKEMSSKKTAVIQSFIEQHSFFDEIMPNSVATLRLTTAITPEGEVKVVSAFLRVGRSSEKHIYFSSNIMIHIDVDTGEFHEWASTPQWTQVNKHPDTNFIFKNKKFPYFNKCVEVVTQFHEKVPFDRIIGWDLIIDKNDEVKVMEANGIGADIKFSEASVGPIFKGFELESIRKNN